MDMQDQMDNALQSHMEAADMWSGIDDRQTAAWVIFDTLFMANPIAVFVSEFQAKVALAVFQSGFTGQNSRWQLASGAADGRLRHGDVVRVAATYLGYGAPPTAAKISETESENNAFRARVVDIEAPDATDDLLY